MAFARLNRDYDLRVHWARTFFNAAADRAEEAATQTDLPPRDRFRRLAVLFRAIAADAAQNLLSGQGYAFHYARDPKGRLIIAASPIRD